MKNKKLIIGISAAALAVVGLFLVFKGMKKPEGDTTTPTPNPPTPTPPSEYNKFEVATLVSNLNVRQSPSTSSPVVGSLPKGTIIFAKPSGTSGWYAYSKDGVTADGFVSSLYLKTI